MLIFTGGEAVLSVSTPMPGISVHPKVGGTKYCKLKYATVFYLINHKNYNFLNCDWFKKLRFPNSLAKLLSDSLLSDSLLSDSLLSDSSTNQSHSKL